VLEEQGKIEKTTTSTTTTKTTTMTMTSLDISIVQIMLFTKHHYLLYMFLITLTNSCNIWKASDCPQPPTADDEEIV
jgi:hypothetical protein